jgi:hypothetical protein
MSKYDAGMVVDVTEPGAEGTTGFAALWSACASIIVDAIKRNKKTSAAKGARQFFALIE